MAILNPYNFVTQINPRVPDDSAKRFLESHHECALRASFSCENARVGLRGDTFVRSARLPSARNNKTVIGILGRFCINIQGKVASIDAPFSSPLDNYLPLWRFHSRDMHCVRFPFYSPFFGIPWLREKRCRCEFMKRRSVATKRLLAWRTLVEPISTFVIIWFWNASSTFTVP